MDRLELARRSNLLFAHKTVAAIALADCVSGQFPASKFTLRRCVKRYKAYCKAWNYVQDLIWSPCYVRP